MIRDTQLIPVADLVRDAAGLDRAAEIIARGGLVAIPTETVYGLAANACDEAAVRSIFEAKGRPQDNPLIVHIAEPEALSRVARVVPEAALRLAEQFWPGPLTMILPKTDLIPAVTSAGLDTVAIRLPGHPVAREIIRRAGVPVAAPSANRSGSPSTTTAQHCMNDLAGRVDAVVDSGPCTVGVESTVISLAGEIPRLLRPGYVTLEQLRSVLGEVALDQAVINQPDPNERVASPGMKYKHYAPRCRVILLDGSRDAFVRYINSHQGAGVFAFCYEEDLPYLHGSAISLGQESDEAAQAAHLFDSLRQMDEKGASLVYARCPKQQGIGLALYNRLVRAAAFEVITL